MEERESATERQGKRKGVRFLLNYYTPSWSQVLWGRLGWTPHGQWRREMPWALALACWALGTIDTPPKDTVCF